MPDPKNPGDRVKAHKLRAAVKAGKALQPVDTLWLAEYADNQKGHVGGRSKNFGRSRSARKIDLKIEEAAEAEGEGSAAVAAASAALVAKEEGRRFDALLLGSVDAMKAAAEMNLQSAKMVTDAFGSIFNLLTDRTEVLERTHIEMLQSVRAHHIAATEMQSALIAQQNDGDPAKDMLTMLIAKHLGIPVGALPAPQNGARPQRPFGPQQQRPPKA